MKTTLEIQDALLLRAKHWAKNSGRPLRAIVEEGLRLALEKSNISSGYKLANCSAGESQGDNPLESMSWQDIREEVYGAQG